MHIVYKIQIISHIRGYVHKLPSANMQIFKLQRKLCFNLQNDSQHMLKFNSNV